MKHILNIRIPTLIAILLIAFSFSDCCKEKKPTMIGKWETIESFSYKWEFDIRKTGELCRKFPPAFGTTSFCFPYEANGLTLILNAPIVEVWEWEFDDYENARITATAPDGEIYKMRLKRIE